MAANGNIDGATQTYESFVGFVKWGTFACAAVAALVVVLIAS